MELRQLEYFVAVVEEASFTKAAARLHVAQPGVSAQIRRLERKLGQELLDRSGRLVRVTEVGAAVLPYARAALAAITDTRLVVDELTGLVRGHVAVGMVPSCGGFSLPALLAGFHEEHPSVEITLSEANSEELVHSLRAGRLDAAFIALSGGDVPVGLATHVMVDEPLVATVSPGDPLATRGTITLDDIRDRALISLPPGTGMRKSLDAACAEAGLTPRISFEAGNPGILAELASRGLGVAILPQSLVRSHPARLCAIPFSYPELRGQVALGWRVDGPVSPAARAFVDRVRSTTRQPDTVGAGTV
ncbi:LysR family transcriptional regulator [Streptomyces sp. NPDC057621]|uniref:LysR family transcriptional regulator n=1 Tax=Streptomyces liliiviolaceus TaxID=2823109 RepID=A0A941B4L0_9ACTN|nr:LysR family transcriptional regulator [Streptomyces liliiviolaceus]MBQ0850480.1 LysR family transcriptional regulator [Streptomyces liliiviolaceus]